MSKFDKIYLSVSAEKTVCQGTVELFFGCEGQEDFRALTGLTFRGMVHPEDYGRISASIADQIREGRADIDTVEYRIIRKDGKLRRIFEDGIRNYRVEFAKLDLRKGETKFVVGFKEADEETRRS